MMKSSPSKQSLNVQSTEVDAAATVSIVGYSLRAPGCSSVAEFAQALRQGQDLTTANTRYRAGFLGLPPRQGRLNDDDLKYFSPSFFGLSHKQAERMDPAIRLLLKVSYEALMDAQINIAGLRGSNTGVYVGHIFSDYLHLMGRPSTSIQKDGYELVNGAPSMAANRLSYFYDLRGPSMTIDTACSSSLIALDRAAKDIKNGIIDRAIVGGISLTLDPHKSDSFQQFKMLSPTGRCYSFDKRADGYCRSEAVACVILERSSNGYAIVAGSGTNSDGFTPQGITYPSPSQQVAVLQQALAESNVNPDEICYHEAHGTGTVAGDREELFALCAVYSHPLCIGSVKSNMGHAEGCSGLMGVIKILLMYEDQTLYPNFDFQESPHSPIQQGRLSVVKVAKTWTPGPCSLSNFGFGGSNACAILAPCHKRKTLEPSENMVSLSGVHPFSSVPGMSPFPFEQEVYMGYYALQKAIGNDGAFPFEWKNKQWIERSPLVFVLDGQGSQWTGMGKDLMEKSPTFRSTIEQLEKDTNIPLVELYEDGTQWMLRQNTVLGIVSFQLGIIELLSEEGIQPDYFLGHSLGEIVCSYLAGFQTAAEVMHVAQVRAELGSLINNECRLDVYAEKPEDGAQYISFSESSTPCCWAKQVPIGTPRDLDAIESFSLKGKMVVVGCEATVIEKAIATLGLEQTCVACYNAPKGQTVSGPAEEVDQLVFSLQEETPNLFIRNIPTDDTAYHAPYLRVFGDSLKAKFGNIKRAPLPSSWLSTSRNKDFSVDYLVDNICGPVYFSDAIKKLPLGSTVVEIGPASGLLAQVKRTRSDLKRLAIIEREEPADLVAALQQLSQWSSLNSSGEAGHSIDKGVDTLGKLQYQERYPDIWGRQDSFDVPDWEAFELPVAKGDSRVMIFDLTKAPWSSIRHHVIRGQNLFPACGFVYALWSTQGFKGGTEIRDFRVISPLVISETTTQIELRLQQAGQFCEIWGVDGDTRYASGHVSSVDGTSRPCSTTEEQVEGIDCRHFYSYIRGLGYEYGPQYQLLEHVTEEQAHFAAKPNDWVSYLDTFLHLHIFRENAFGYPVGVDRITLWEQSIDKAGMFVRCRSSGAYASSNVLMEGVRIDFLPVTTKLLPVYSEVFVEYDETDTPLDASILAALLIRESRQFRVAGPIESPELESVIKKMRGHRLAAETTSTWTVVFSDKHTADADLLVTTDDTLPTFPHCLVARWGTIRLYRSNHLPSVKVVHDWRDVPSDVPFIWEGQGSSGAVASLEWERNQTAIGYEGTSGALLGLEKGMRVNFVLDGTKHGVFVAAKDVHQRSGPHHIPVGASLEIKRPGFLDSLAWSSIDPGTHSVQISAATLNFRDVMRAMGQLKEKDLSLGLEFSGVDRKNQRLFGITKHALSTHCTPLYCFPTPEDLTDEQAATIPIVYLTAYFAMFGKANMKQGQSILIHAGAGGVGMAAITIAQKRGFQVFTTCSTRKRSFLKERFGLADSQIGDSRSEGFVETVIQGTDGRGVDVVLNQLSGPLQVASLRCLASGGQFCEIGKYDILKNTKLGQGLLVDNVSFHVIDLLPLLSDPSNKPRWDGFLKEGFRRNEILPLPVTTFSPDETTDAFRFMSQGKHMGKIVITGIDSHKFRVPGGFLASASKRGEVHLITGGLGGLGLSLARQLAQQGCSEVILVGRSGITNSYQRHQIKKMESMGCNVRVVQRSLLDINRRSLPAPSCVWHAATVYRDMRFDQMTESAWDAVVSTKVDGYRHLRKCWEDVPIVAISSVSGHYGNTMQTNYGLANACLDAAARVDPKTLSIRLGPLDDVGFVNQAHSHRAVLDRLDYVSMKVADVLEQVFQICAENESGVFGIYEMKSKIENGNGAPAHSSPSSIQTEKSYSRRHAQTIVANILGGSPEQYDSHMPLKKAGLDSLSSMEIANHIHEMSGSNGFKVSQIGDNFTVEDIVRAVNTGRRISTSGDPNNTQQQQTPRQLSNDRGSIQQEWEPSSGHEPADSLTHHERNRGSMGLHLSRPNELPQFAEDEEHGCHADPSYPFEADYSPSNKGSVQRASPLSSQQLLESFFLQQWTTERTYAGIAILFSVVFWIFSLVYFDNTNTNNVLHNALVAFCACYMIRLFVNLCLLKGIHIRGGAFPCAHYLQGSILYLIYIVLYVLGGSDVFLEHWSAVYFGCFLFDSIGIVGFWDSLPRDFRRFYSIHNALSFAMTGCWRVPSGEWEQLLVLAVMLFLSSELWQHILFVFRNFRGRAQINQKGLLSFQLLAFGVERLQRIAAFLCFAFLEEREGLAKLVLSTGVIVDLVDIYFQGKSLWGRYISLVDVGYNKKEGEEVSQTSWTPSGDLEQGLEKDGTLFVEVQV